MSLHTVNESVTREYKRLNNKTCESIIRIRDTDAPNTCVLQKGPNLKQSTTSMNRSEQENHETDQQESSNRTTRIMKQNSISFSLMKQKMNMNKKQI